VTQIPYGQDGRGHQTAVIDCHDRELIGCEFTLPGCVQKAERTIVTGCLARLGRLCSFGSTPVLRSENGLVLQSR